MSATSLEMEPQEARTFIFFHVPAGIKLLASFATITTPFSMEMPETNAPFSSVMDHAMFCSAMSELNWSLTIAV